MEDLAEQVLLTQTAAALIQNQTNICQQLLCSSCNRSSMASKMTSSKCVLQHTLLLCCFVHGKSTNGQCVTLICGVMLCCVNLKADSKAQDCDDVLMTRRFWPLPDMALTKHAIAVLVQMQACV